MDANADLRPETFPDCTYFGHFYEPANKGVDVIASSGSNVVTFLNQDTNGVVTFIINREDLVNYIFGFATKEATALDGGSPTGGYGTWAPYLVLGANVRAVPTTMALASSGSPTPLGGNVTFTATVQTNGLTAGNAGGSVIFNSGTTTLGIATVTNGLASLITAALAFNTNLVTAVYVGDSNYLGSTSLAVTQVVQMQVTVVLQSLVNPSVAGNGGASYQIDLQTNGVTIAGSVDGTGTITLKEGATVVGISIPVTSGTSFGSDFDSLARGWHYLKAEFSGSDLYLPSTNAVPLAQAVATSSQTLSSLTLGSSPNPSVLGGSVLLTATVSGSDATGTVVFKDAGVTLGSAGVTNGVATFTTSGLAAGARALTAEYSGDSIYSPSPGATSQAVQLPTTTTLASSANPSTNGSSLTLTATVKTNNATASAAGGTMSFYDNVSLVGSAAVVNGVATYSTTALLPGAHPLTAQYSGDTYYLPSTTASALAQVVKWASTTALASSLNPSTNGNSVTFTATVQTNGVAAGDVTGTMVFKSGATTLGNPGVTNGVATFATTALPAGTNSITAAYSGDSVYAGSLSTTLLEVVQSSLATTRPTLSSSVNGSTLTLSWPADHLGWILQGQTNSAGVGNNWADIPGTALVISTNRPISTANPSVFYRLRYPNP